jgi:Ca2+-binding RTX toxin-like protein
MAEVSVSLLEFDDLHLKPGDTAEIGISVSATGFGPVTSLHLHVRYYTEKIIPITEYSWTYVNSNTVGFDSEHYRTGTIPVNNGAVSEDFLFDISFPINNLNSYASGSHDLFLEVSSYWYDEERNFQHYNFKEKIGVTHADIQADPEGSTPVLIDVKTMSEEQLKLVFEHIASLKNAAIKSVEFEQNGTLYKGDDFTTLTLALLTQDHWEFASSAWHGRLVEYPTTVDFTFDGEPFKHILSEPKIQSKYEEFLSANNESWYALTGGIFTSAQGWTVDLGFLSNFVIWRTLGEKHVLIFEESELVGYIDLDTRSYSAFPSDLRYINPHDDFMLIDSQNNAEKYFIADETIFDMSGHVLNTYSGMNLTINLGNNIYTQIVKSSLVGEIRPNTWSALQAVQNIDLNDINNPLMGVTIPGVVPSGYWEQVSEKLLVSNDWSQNDSRLLWINQRAAGNDGMLMGTNTADVLFSFDGNDLIAAGDGNDTLNGGLGADTLFGGNGSDTFKFSSIHGLDVIKDFNPMLDKIEYVGSSLQEDSWEKSLNNSGHDIIVFEENDANNQLIVESDFAGDSLQFDLQKMATIELIDDHLTTTLSLDNTGKATAHQAEFNSVKITGITDINAQIGSATVNTDPITISDVIAQLRDIVGLDELRGKAHAAADIDNDGEVQITDVIANLRNIVGLDNTDTFDLVTDNGFAINALHADSVGSLSLVINGDADLSHADFIIA